MSPEARRRERRAEIVAAAIRAAGRRSLSAVSVADVASEAGISKAAVFKYFPARADLVAGVLDELQRFFLGLYERARADSDDPVRVLLNLSLGYAASLETHLDHARIVLSWTGWSAEDPEISRRANEMFRAYVGLVEATIREGIDRKTIPSDIDTSFAAWTFMGYAFTVGSAKILGRPPEWISQLQIALLRHLLGHRALDRVLAGSKTAGLSRRGTEGAPPAVLAGAARKSRRRSRVSRNRGGVGPQG